MCDEKHILKGMKARDALSVTNSNHRNDPFFFSVMYGCWLKVNNLLHPMFLDGTLVSPS